MADRQPTPCQACGRVRRYALAPRYCRVCADNINGREIAPPRPEWWESHLDALRMLAERNQPLDYLRSV